MMGGGGGGENVCPVPPPAGWSLHPNSIRICEKLLRVVQHDSQPSLVLVVAANGVERRIGILPLEVGFVLVYSRAGDSLLARDHGNVLKRLP